ncbi:MAG: hypothetical protein EBX40_08040, partial [Gammaproteobacteria bacterium]|nr:hypothetical protein [Gammaproteobacteria bacterium]
MKKSLLVLTLCSLGITPCLASSDECGPNGPNNWIGALIAQDPPDFSSPSSVNGYAQKIYALAPMAEQIHLRVNGVKPDDPNAHTYSPSNPMVLNYVMLINDIKQLYPGTVQIGYHPDNSKNNDMYPTWGCSVGDDACVISNTIGFMNAVNAQIPNSNGFQIFSIEQSYIESPMSLSTLKSCLTGSSCPYVAANPPVKFGNVGPSYGGPDIYGPNALDYGYPQYYNIEHKITLDGSNTPFPVDAFPNASGQNADPAGTYDVVDADTPGAWVDHPEIPAELSKAEGGDQSKTVYTISNIKEDRVTFASSFVGYLFSTRQMGQQYPNATVYLTLSGEPDFLGDPYWNLQNLCLF